MAKRRGPRVIAVRTTEKTSTPAAKDEPLEESGERELLSDNELRRLEGALLGGDTYEISVENILRLTAELRQRRAADAEEDVTPTE